MLKYQPIFCYNIVPQRESVDFWQRCKKTHVGEKTVSSTNSVGKTRYPHIKDWS
jgi:hypothetical protein